MTKDDFEQFEKELDAVCKKYSIDLSSTQAHYSDPDPIRASHCIPGGFFVLIDTREFIFDKEEKKYPWET